MLGKLSCLLVLCIVAFTHGKCIPQYKRIITVVQFDTEAGNRTRSKYHCKIACIKMQSYTSRPSILVIDAVKDTIIYFTNLRACLIYMMLYVEEMYYSCTIVHILSV